MIPYRKVGDIVICPVCGKQYKYTENHKFVRGDEFVCSWVCFLGKQNKTAENKKFEVSAQSEKKKRGRPKKNANKTEFVEEVLF